MIGNCFLKREWLGSNKGRKLRVVLLGNERNWRKCEEIGRQDKMDFLKLEGNFNQKIYYLSDTNKFQIHLHIKQ
jgi:hypothetical protein